MIASGKDDNDGEDNDGKDEQKGEVDDDDQKFLPLQCGRYGGPTEKISSEMVYWKDIPSDAKYRNPFQRLHSKGKEKFATFEPDIGKFLS